MSDEVYGSQDHNTSESHELTMTPLVSVIIPTYNRAKFVVEAIESVLNQSFQNYELIVVDDGSSDGTRQALQPYLSIIKYIYQENAGVSAARNTGIRAAKGEWLAFLDSDDIWGRGYLATQMEQVNRFPRAVAHITNTAMVFSDASYNHFEEIHFLDKFANQPNTIVLKKPLCAIIKYPYWLFPAVIFHRDTLLQVGLFDESLSVAEDLDVVARIALMGEFTFRKEELVYAIRREEKIVSLATQSFINNVIRHKSFAKVYAELLSWPGLNFIERITIARALSYNLRVVGNCLLNDAEIFRARQFYWKSFSSFPSIKSFIKFIATFLPKSISRLVVIKCKGMTSGAYKLSDLEN